MVETPIPRQPSCRYCEPHEEHIYSRCLVDGVCPCPPKQPIGIYDNPGGSA